MCASEELTREEKISDALRWLKEAGCEITTIPPGGQGAVMVEVNSGDRVVVIPKEVERGVS